LIVAIFDQIKLIFRTTYVYIFKRLNQFLPLPFVSTAPLTKPKDPVQKGRPRPANKPKNTIKKKIPPS
jgi:hypothetical protein